MRSIPRDPRFDGTGELLADPYRYISRRCREYGTDLFEMRLLLRPTIFMTGPRAAELFYDPRRFRRRGAAPEPVRATLLGKGGVQGLDDEAHRHRKAMFMAVLGPGRVADLDAAVAAEWLRCAHEWGGRGPIVLYDALHELLTRAVCVWAGVPLPTADVALRAAQLTALFDSTASGAMPHLRARVARKRAEHWMAALVRDIRSGRLAVTHGCPAYIVAWHRNTRGNLLPSRVAAVELLNLLRPTVAVSVFIVFAAHALRQHPACREALAAGDDAYAACFVQEVRRWYPFFPAVAARVRESFEWEGYRFPRGRRVLLDLYGTDHDARTWAAPQAFRPERFLTFTPTPYEFIPQGGANAEDNHRCPGEGVAVALIKTSVDFLVRRLDYHVPQQNLEIDFSRLPALPHDGFVIDEVRVKS